MPTVYDLTREQLTDRLVAWGEPAFRAKQVWTQLWKRAATYDQMSDVSPTLGERLAADPAPSGSRFWKNARPTGA
jgi:23S rRNA (adenine2503-C2)-methyltransferase